MGEAKRRKQSLWPGSSRRCPACLGTRVATTTTPDSAQIFYGRSITVCGGCGAAWEPIKEEDIWDRDDPACSGREPCDNCAFRPGSPEQADKEKWSALIESLKSGGQFFCHKGVPIDPESEDGFKYPKREVSIGEAGTTRIHDTNKLRLCRGYLNALGKWWKTERTAGP